jgi:hypothetical protein
MIFCSTGPDLAFAETVRWLANATKSTLTIRAIKTNLARPLQDSCSLVWLDLKKQNLVITMI